MAKQKKLGHYLRFSYFCAMLFWGILCYLEIYKIWAKGNLFAFLEEGRPYLNDYTFHFAAALLGRDCLNKPVNIYDAQLQFDCMKSFLKVFPESPMYMQYPPYCFTLDTPLAYLGLDLSYLIWILASLLAAILAFHFCLRSYLSSKIEYAFALTAMLSAFPFWLSIRLGQSSIFLFASMLFFFYFLKEKADKKSSPLLAGLSSFYIFVKLQYLPYIAVIGLVKNRLAFAKGFFLTALLLTAICFITPGWHNVIAYPSALLEHEILKPAAGVSVEEMQNLRGQLTLLDNKFAISHFFPTKLLTGGAAVLAILYIGSLWWRLRKLFKEANQNQQKILLENLAMSTAVLLMLTTSPHVHRQDYVLLALPALIYHWAGKEFFTSPRAHQAIKFCSSLSFIFPFLSWFLFIGNFLFQQFLYIQPFFVYALFLLAANIYAFEKTWQANKTNATNPTIAD
jgi:hypothetical protein